MLAILGTLAKYGLLRSVGEGRRLGIAWYLCAEPEKVGTGDGRHTGYLREPERWRHFDSDLFDTLKGLVEEDKRSVAEIQNSGILGAAEFVGDPVDCAWVGGRESGNGRRQWFERVLSRLSACDLVFADPDNGLYVDAQFNPEKREKCEADPARRGDGARGGPNRHHLSPQRKAARWPYPGNQRMDVTYSGLRLRLLLAAVEQSDVLHHQSGPRNGMQGRAVRGTLERYGRAGARSFKRTEGSLDGGNFHEGRKSLSVGRAKRGRENRLRNLARVRFRRRRMIRGKRSYPGRT